MLARLKTLDANGDKVLTKDELPERAQGILDRADKDNNGSVSFEELDAMAKMARPRDGSGNQFNQRGKSPRGEGDRPGGDRPRRPPAE